MATYQVQLRDGSTHRIGDVDAYQPERTITTFFRSNNARRAMDCWSDRVASFRTDEVLMIRLETTHGTGNGSEPAAPMHLVDPNDHVVGL